jgi:septal ring factor EnvC (AmiA/AmiB activator)
LSEEKHESFRQYVTDCLLNAAVFCHVCTQTEDCRKLQAKVKALEEDRNKWQQQAGMLRDSLQKQEILHSSTVAKLTQQEAENLSLKKVHIIQNVK